jgi:hypothetical protein
MVMLGELVATWLDQGCVGPARKKHVVRKIYPPIDAR